MKKLFSLKPERIVKRIIALLTPFLILTGAGVITNLLILNISDTGFFSISTATVPIYLLGLLMISYFIYELNTKLENSSAAVGLVISIIYSLPLLIIGFASIIEFNVVLWNITNNIFSITLASYVFSMMWN